MGELDDLGKLDDLGDLGVLAIGVLELFVGESLLERKAIKVKSM